MRTTFLIALLLVISASVSNAAEKPGCILTIFWEHPNFCVSASFLCDWVATADVQGADGVVIVWGDGKEPKTLNEMFDRCGGWRDGDWTRAELGVIR